MNSSEIGMVQEMLQIRNAKKSLKVFGIMPAAVRESEFLEGFRKF